MKSILYSSQCSTGMFHGEPLDPSGAFSPASLPLRVSTAFQKPIGRQAAVFLGIEYLRQKSFLRYAWRQVSRAAGTLNARAQLGGMRLGRVQAPSRIFLSAM